MKNFDWPSTVYRVFAIANFVVVAIGLAFLVRSTLGVHTSSLGNTVTQPYFLHFYWTMIAANLCFFVFLVLGAVYLLRLRALGVAICSIVFTGEILYFLGIGFLSPFVPRDVAMSIAGAAGIGNLPLYPQLVSAYPLLGLGCLNLARFRRSVTVHSARA